MKKNNTTNATFTSKITDTKNFKVTIQHYMNKPSKTIPVGFCLAYLDLIQENLGWSDTELNGYSPKCLAADMACYMEKTKIVQHFINNATIKAGLRNEKVEFIADLACYAHCVGSIFEGDITDAMWSIFNAIKMYVNNNWTEENACKFFMNID